MARGSKHPRRATVAAWAVGAVAWCVAATVPPILGQPAATRPAASRPTATRPAGAGAIEEVRLPVGRANEFDGMIADLQLDAEQKAAVKQKTRERMERLRAFFDGPRGTELVALRSELAAARRAKQDERVAELEARIGPLMDEYWDLRNATRAGVLAVLTPEQLDRYGGFVLAERVGRTFRLAKLTKAQRQRVRELCDAAAAPVVTPQTPTDDPFFASLDALQPEVERQVRGTVLTDAQRAAVAPGAATRPQRPLPNDGPG